MCYKNTWLREGLSSSQLYSCSDSADVESLGQDSSGEESEEREEEEQIAEVTSMDEALKAVTDAADRSQVDFLKQNYETLAESCSTGKTHTAQHVCEYRQNRSIDRSGAWLALSLSFSFSLCVTVFFPSPCRCPHFSSVGFSNA